MKKLLILNADDYGACDEVNQAVEKLAEQNILANVSVLANGSKWESAVTFLLAHPHISAGIHLNLVDGPALSTPSEIALITDQNRHFQGRQKVMRQWLLHPRKLAHAVETEWRAQIERLLQAGLTLSHVDSHQHLHAFPPAFRIAARLCAEYQIPAIRIPAERNNISQRKLLTIALNACLQCAQVLSPNSTLKVNHHFLGFKRAGAYDQTALLHDLTQLQPGITEIALHPSKQNHRPYQALRGADELAALLSPEFKSCLQTQQIQLTRWSEI